MGGTSHKIRSPQNPVGQARGTLYTTTKRRRQPESETPRKSARIANIQQSKPESIHRNGAPGMQSTCGRIRGQEKAAQPGVVHSLDRKRPRLQSDRPERCRKRQRATVEENTLEPGAVGTNEDEQHPIAYWSHHGRWPHDFCQNIGEMENTLARKRSVSSRSRKSSDADSAVTPSSTAQTEQKSREQKSAEYSKPQYEIVLMTKGILMEASARGVNDSSKTWCKDLLEKEQEYPKDTLFQDDLFDSTCNVIRIKNETRVIRDIALLIVPSAEVFAIRGATSLRCLIESVNEGWNNSIPITKTRPQPDFAVGFCRDAFTQDQLDRMQPVVGDFSSQSFFMGTWYMYFPFLTCEVKCGAGTLDVADRQNVHSAAIAVRAVVELFRAVKREEELHREILAFSVSHDQTTVRIYGYYAEIDGVETKYYRHSIRQFCFTELDGKEKWTAYKFTKNVYDLWMPKHFERICSAINQIPANISFSMSSSELRFSESSGRSIAQSSAGSASTQARDNAQSSTSADPAATPTTSITEGVFKRPRKENY